MSRLKKGDFLRLDDQRPEEQQEVWRLRTFKSLQSFWKDGKPFCWRWVIHFVDLRDCIIISGEYSL
jgi:hypothetical protein